LTSFSLFFTIEEYRENLIGSLVTKTLLAFAILVGSFVSCSTVEFKSGNQSKVTFDYNLNQEREVILEVEKKFYLWGALPSKHELILDKIFKDRGFENVSDLRIEEVNTTRKAAWMVASFGMFYPVSYRLVGRIKD
tara:strand:- start:4825 stop:5232 length:408 start_codon:yes stop_codon:yes gene_type:complete